MSKRKRNNAVKDKKDSGKRSKRQKLDKKPPQRSRSSSSSSDESLYDDSGRKITDQQALDPLGNEEMKERMKARSVPLKLIKSQVTIEGQKFDHVVNPAAESILRLVMLELAKDSPHMIGEDGIEIPLYEQGLRNWAVDSDKHPSFRSILFSKVVAIHFASGLPLDNVRHLKEVAANLWEEFRLSENWED